MKPIEFNYEVGFRNGKFCVLDPAGNVVSRHNSWAKAIRIRDDRSLKARLRHARILAASSPTRIVIERRR